MSSFDFRTANVFQILLGDKLCGKLVCQKNGENLKRISTTSIFQPSVSDRK